MFERDEPGAADADVFARWGRPHQIASEDPVAHVEYPEVLRRACGREEQRFVVDVQLDDRRVGHVDDRLSDARQAERVLGMDDRPCLVETVDEGARLVSRDTLVRATSDAEVPVGQRECRLGATTEPVRPAGLDDPPLVGREEMLGWHLDRALDHL